jgi:hypothetical protein
VDPPVRLFFCAALSLPASLEVAFLAGLFFSLGVSFGLSFGLDLALVFGLVFPLAFELFWPLPPDFVFRDFSRSLAEAEKLSIVLESWRLYAVDE